MIFRQDGQGITRNEQNVAKFRHKGTETIERLKIIFAR
jgi:hypothetical protein